MAVIATAEVRVIADTSRFLSNLRRQLRGAFGDVGGDSARQFSREFREGIGTDLLDILRRAARGSGRIMGEAGENAAGQFNREFRSEIGEISRITTDALRDVGVQAAIQGARFGGESGDAFTATFRNRIEGQLTDSVEAAFNRSRSSINNIFARSGREAAVSFSSGFLRPGPAREAFQEILDDIENRTRQSAPRLRRAGAQLAQAFGQGAATARIEIADNLANQESRLRSIARRIGSYIRSNITGETNDASRALRGLRNVVGRVGRTVRSLITNITLTPIQNLGRFFSEASSDIGQFVVVATALIGVLQQLSGLLFGLPAAIATIGGAVATIMVATRGMGEAFRAALGDAEEFEEAIEDLAPAAADAAREFRSFRTALRSLRIDVQQAFWEQLDGAITRVGRNLGGPVRSGMIAASTELGVLVDQIADFLAQSETADTVALAFEAVEAVFRGMSQSVQPFLEGIRALVDEFLPRIIEFEEPLSRVGDEFREWAEAAVESGDAMEAFDRAVGFLRDMLSVARNVSRALDAIFDAAENIGVSFPQTLVDLSEDLAEFFESGEGQRFAENFLLGLDRIVREAAPLLGTLLQQFGNLTNPIADILEAISPDLEEFIRGIGEGFAAFLREAQPFFEEVAEALADIDWVQVGESIGRAFGDLAEIIETLNESGFFENIGEWIGFAIETAAQFLLILFRIAEWVVEAIDAVSDFFTDIGEFFQGFADDWGEFWRGLAQQAVDELWGLIQEILEAWGNFWGDLFSIGDEGMLSILDIFSLRGVDLGLSWDGILSGLESALGLSLGNMGSEIGSSLSNFLTRFTDWGGSLSGWWDGLWSGIGNRLSGAFSGMASRIRGALASIRGALENMVSNFTSFFGTIVSRVRGAAGNIASIVSNIISTINSIPSIPSGGGLFDFFADGGIVTRPTFAMIGEAGPEAVIPLNNPSRAIALAEQSGLADLLASQAPPATDSSAPPVSPEIHVHSNVADPEQIARRAARILQRQLRGRGLERD